MLKGSLMPHKPAVLASVLSVTFLGKGQPMETWWYSTFKVQHYCVQAVLCWLIANNAKYYGDIQINEEHMKLLPEDDIPNKIMSIIYHSEDDTVILAENDNYVPEEWDEDCLMDTLNGGLLWDVFMISVRLLMCLLWLFRWKRQGWDYKYRDWCYG